MQNLNLERLESREVPAGQILFNPVNGSLLVQGDRGDNTISTQLINGQVVAQVDNLIRTFAAGAVQSVTLDGGPGNDDLTNRLQVRTTLLGGAGNDSLQDFSGQGTLIDLQGNNIGYAILGTNVVTVRGRIVSNLQSQVVTVPGNPPPVLFGARAGQDGFAVDNGVLYLAGTAGADRVLIERVRNQILVTYSLNDGAIIGSQVFAASQVRAFASLTGGGDDVIVNEAAGLDVVVYTGAGNDTVVTGRAGFALLKGGGGNDLLDASGARQADLTGDGGADILAGPAGNTVFRTDGLDQFRASRGDKVIGPLRNAA